MNPIAIASPSFRSVLATLAVALSLCPGSVGAQDGREAVLRGSQVTEAALVDALSIDAQAASQQLPRTRGFRPAAQPATTTLKGKASLLMTFDTDSTELTGDTRKMLDVLARALQSDQLARNTFRIEGHADARGGDEHNRALSQARAQAVAGYLVSRHRIAQQRLVAIGKGASEPLNPERADAPENRRVTIVTDRN